MVDSGLTYRLHISQIIKKARSRCALFLKIFITREPKMMVRFLTSYVRPLLEYGSSVRSPINSLDISRLEGVQRFFTNKVPGCRFLPYHTRLTKLSLHSLQHRRKVADLVFLHSIITGRANVSLAPHLLYVPPSVTRGHNLKIILPCTRYLKSTQNFLSRVAPEWNKLSPSTLESSVDLFKRIMIKSIVDAYIPTNWNCLVRHCPPHCIFWVMTVCDLQLGFTMFYFTINR